jgi:hypothetical protein
MYSYTYSFHDFPYTYPSSHTHTLILNSGDSFKKKEALLSMQEGGSPSLQPIPSGFSSTATCTAGAVGTVGSQPVDAPLPALEKYDQSSYIAFKVIRSSLGGKGHDQPYKLEKPLGRSHSSLDICYMTCI